MADFGTFSPCKGEVLQSCEEIDLPYAMWLRREGLMDDAKARAEYGDYRDELKAKREKAFEILAAWPGVLNTPSIIDMCENDLRDSPDGAILFRALRRPLDRSHSRDQEGIAAKLAKVQLSADRPNDYASPLGTSPTFESFKAQARRSSRLSHSSRPSG